MLSRSSTRQLPRPRPASAPPSRRNISDADFQKLKTATTPIFDSAIALDDANKKDYAGAIAAYTNELKAYPDSGPDAEPAQDSMTLTFWDRRMRSRPRRISRTQPGF